VFPNFALGSWHLTLAGDLFRNDLNGWNCLNCLNAFYIASGKPAITATVMAAVSAVKCQ
jgi:hypothetical protein